MSAIAQGQGFKHAGSWLLEASTVLLLVLLFFVLILSIVQTVFPSGPTLASLLRAANPFDLMARPFSDRDGLTDAGTIGNESAAVLAEARRTVYHKPAGAVAWTPATQGLELNNRDAIQTLSRSGAVIRFFNDDVLTLGENTLVIINQVQDDMFSNKKRSVLTLVDGELWGRVTPTQRTSAGASSYEIAVAGSIAKIKLDAKDGGKPEFKITVDPKTNIAALTMFKGEAEIATEGLIQLIQSRESVQLEVDQPTPPPRPIPDPPELIQPKHGFEAIYRDLPPRINFEWIEAKNAEAYLFILARDELFLDVVDYAKVKVPYFTHGNLKEGDYYWKVSTVGTGGEGEFSAVLSLKVIRDDVPPRLNVRFPPRTLSISRYMITGETEPSAKVLIDGQEVEVDENGRFSLDFQLRSGSNVIVVEAIDAQGNIAYETARIYGKFGEDGDETTLSPTI